MVAGSVVGVWPRHGPVSNPPWGEVWAPLAGGSGVSCCVARGVPGVLRVGVVLALPASMRRRLWGGKGCMWVGLGLK